MKPTNNNTYNLSPEEIVRPRMRGHEITAEYGVSRATVNRLVLSGDFPPPVKISYNTVVWIRDEVEKWWAERVASRKQSKKLI